MLQAFAGQSTYPSLFSGTCPPSTSWPACPPNFQLRAQSPGGFPVGLRRPGGINPPQRPASGVHRQPNSRWRQRRPGIGPVVVRWSNTDTRRGRGLNHMASGNLRYRRTVFRDTSSSWAIPRIERPAPFISYISFTSPTFSNLSEAPPHSVCE